MLDENKEKELGLKAWQRSGGRILTLHLSSLLAVQLQLICGPHSPQCRRGTPCDTHKHTHIVVPKMCHKHL